MEHTESIYVNVNNGDDINGDGSINSPFSTIERAINSVATTSPIIYLDKGIYPITMLQNLSLTNKKITIKGKNLDTVIEVMKSSYLPEKYLGEVYIYNLVITPSSSFSQRVISYSNDNYKVTFNNVLFKKNNRQPTEAWFFSYNSGSSYHNKDFYNCTFTGEIPVCDGGSVNIFDCALQHSSFGNVATNEDSVLNCEYDSDYKIINYDNYSYGVYSGKNTWRDYKFLLKQNNQYYTIKPEYYSNGQFQPLTLEGGAQPNENDYESFGFEDVNDLLASQNTKTIQGIDMGILGEGKYFEVELDNEIKKINTTIKEAEDLYSSIYSKGNRNDLIKATIKEGCTSTGNITNMLNGTSAQDFYFVNGKTDTWILFEFNELVCVQEIKWIQDRNAGHGKWKLQGSNDNDSFVDLGELFDLDNGIFPIVNNEKYKYYKLQQIEGTISKSPWLYEIEFGIKTNINKYLIKHNNQLYTFNNSNIDLSLSQELNQDNFKNNGFSNPSDITEEQWNNAFPDKADVKLLMWTDDMDKTEIKAECEIEPFTPYDKLENEFEICMAMDKE